MCIFLNKVQLINFFLDCAFGVLPEKSTPNLRSPKRSSVLPSRTFISLHFTFRSMIHSVLILGKVWRLCLDTLSLFFFSHLAVPLCQCYLLKKQSFLHWRAFAFLSEIIDCICIGLYIFVLSSWHMWLFFHQLSWFL